MNRLIKMFIKSKILRPFVVIFNLVLNVNVLKVGFSSLLHNVIVFNKILIKGKKNKIAIGKSNVIHNCRVVIIGDNNKIFIANESHLHGVELFIQGDNNYISIGTGTSINEQTQLACIEGTKILIGENCMFSSQVNIRTGDSHPIYNEFGERINLSKDVVLMNNVWIGNKATILKGCIIGSDSIVGTNAVVTKSFGNNVIIAGNPSRIVKNRIKWER